MFIQAMMVIAICFVAVTVWESAKQITAAIREKRSKTE